MPVEIKIILETEHSHTLSDIRRMLLDPSRHFLVDNAPVATESDVLVASLIQNNSRIEWSEKSILNDTPPLEEVEESLSSSKGMMPIKPLEVEKRDQSVSSASATFSLDSLRDNFIQSSIKFDSLAEAHPDKIGSLVVFYHTRQDRREHKFLESKTFEEAFKEVRADAEIELTKAPLVICLDPDAGRRKSSDQLLSRPFDCSKYSSKSVHESKFLLYKSMAKPTDTCNVVPNMIIDTGCIQTHFFSLNALSTHHLQDSVFAIDFLDNISSTTTPTLLIDGIGIKIGSVEGCGYQEQIVSANLDIDLFMYLLSPPWYDKLDLAPTLNARQKDRATTIFNFLRSVEVQQLILSGTQESMQLLRSHCMNLGLASASIHSSQGVIGKALMDEYVFFSNGPNKNGIRFAPKSFQVRLLDSHGNDITY